MCRYLHVTRDVALPSIAQHGLLPREQLEAMHCDIRYVACTKPGSVYLADTDAFEHNYERGMWEIDEYRVTLCVEPVPGAEIIPDRNFFTDKETRHPWREHRAPVPPDHIRIHHNDGSCEPVTVYVQVK